jgi:hypothetical protein
MNIGQANMQDRALYYIKTYDKDFLEMTDTQFREWAVTIKPFFEEFDEFLKRLDVKQHFMRIFFDIPVTKQEIEDTSTSSANDKHIIEAAMSYPRRVAKEIIEGGRIYEDLSIEAPFPMDEFNRRVEDTCKAINIKFTQPRYVFEEYQSAGLLEPIVINGNRMWRFKYKIGTLAQKFGVHINLTLEPRFEFGEDDFGVNEATMEPGKVKNWRGFSRFRNGI